MRIPSYILNLMQVFPGSFINHNNELILVPRFNVYFGLDSVETEDDLKAKMCEWVSRDCCTALRYSYEWRNKNYWESMTEKFNAVCGTEFDVDDMYIIYTYLGNECNHKKTLDFVKSGFDLKILTDNEVEE